MTCYYPISAWRSKKLNESGKRSIVFTPRDGYIDQPLQVPCEKCQGCIADKRLMWGLRCYHESLQYQSSCMLTLTYDDDHIPADGKITKRELQLLFKKLRKAGCKFRYFACGEYGEQTRRPHYHALIFGEDFQNDALRTPGYSHYQNQKLTDIWGKGRVTINALTVSACFYTAGYVTKKINDKDTFNLMSTRPFIGKHWIDNHLKDTSRDGFCIIDGKKYPVPKRYMQHYEKQFEKIKIKHKKIMRDMPIADKIKRATDLRNKEINRKSHKQTFYKGGNI